MATKEKVGGHKGKSGPKTGGAGSKHRGKGKMPSGSLSYAAAQMRGSFPSHKKGKK